MFGYRNEKDLTKLLNLLDKSYAAFLNGKLHVSRINKI
ncbi:hypothetical protein bcere0018_54090 [Bacillus cereus Rock1-15]|nr:hypothetical protein bcere0018_54090 [Bacillus cereus Rock1-15]